MKGIIILIAPLILAVILFSCQNQHVFNQSPEIDLVKKLNEAVTQQDWATYRSLFHDTAAIYINNWFYQKLTPDQFVEILKKHLENVAEFKIAPNTIYEMVLSPEGHHWVHQWTELIYLLKDGQEVRTVSHASLRVENNKIVFRGCILDPMPRHLTEESIKKGSLISIQPQTIKLKPGITLEQYKDFYITKVIPEFEKVFPGIKGYIVSSVRGKDKSNIAILWVFYSEKSRDQYFNSDDSLNELGKAGFEKMKPVLEKLNELGTSSSEFTDWRVQ